MRQYTENDDKILTDTKEDAQEKTLERLNKIFFYPPPALKLYIGLITSTISAVGSILLIISCILL